jgi:hypothetical protein
VHEHVQPAVPGGGVRGDALRCGRGGDVDLQGSPTDRVGDRREPLALGGQVGADDVGSVARQDARNGCADALGRSGDDGHPASEGPLPVG